jgi:hypothetical protein
MDDDPGGVKGFLNRPVVETFRDWTPLDFIRMRIALGLATFVLGGVVAIFVLAFSDVDDVPSAGLYPLPTEIVGPVDAPRAPYIRISSADFAWVKVGMTRAQVQARLGGAGQASGNDDGCRGYGDASLTFSGFDVCYRDGRVAAKHAY